MSGLYVYGASKQRPQRPAGRPVAPSPVPVRICRTPAALHVPALSPHAEQLHWYVSERGRMRVEAYTCASCRDVSYEYGLLGGAYRIRRTARAPGRPVEVHETPAVRRTVAVEWWHRLLSGRAV